MRISVDSRDPGYLPWLLHRKSVHVRLDGELIEHCVTADTDLGMVEIYRRGNGRFMLEREGGTIMREKRYGKVTLE